MRTITYRPIAIVLGAALLALGLAACGSSDEGTTAEATGSGSASSSGPTGSGSVEVSDAAGIGKVLVDADGRTLYLFEADTGGTSTCTGDCAQAWPPYTTDGKPTASSGADAALLGTVDRADGTAQVTYDGHPLYLFSGDSGPGEANGNGIDKFGAEWYALTPSGANAEEESGAGDEDSSGEGGAETTTDEGSGYGY